jgi:hypothetical protein
MTKPPYETKDVFSSMANFETKDLPGGYAPAAAPFADRTGTQLPQEDVSAEETSTPESEQADEKPKATRRTSAKNSE